MNMQAWLYTHDLFEHYRFEYHRPPTGGPVVLRCSCLLRNSLSPDLTKPASLAKLLGSFFYFSNLHCIILLHFNHLYFNHL